MVTKQSNDKVSKLIINKMGIKSFNLGFYVLSYQTELVHKMWSLTFVPGLVEIGLCISAVYCALWLMFGYLTLKIQVEVKGRGLRKTIINNMDMDNITLKVGHYYTLQ